MEILSPCLFWATYLVNISDDTFVIFIWFKVRRTEQLVAVEQIVQLEVGPSVIELEVTVGEVHVVLAVAFLD